MQGLYSNFVLCTLCFILFLLSFLLLIIRFISVKLKLANPGQTQRFSKGTLLMVK